MTVFTDKAIKYVPRLEMDLGITREQACGIFGNLGTETGGFTALQEIKPTVAGSRGGYGWMQWTGPRRKKYEAWCKTTGKNPADDEANYQYLVLETKTDEAHSLSQLKKTTTVEAATETFMAQNLRPGVKHLDNRIAWAKKADEATKNAAPATTGVVVGGGAVVTGLATTEPKYWIWIFFAALAAGLIGFIVHKRIKEHSADQIHVPVVETKKDKKNGK